MNKHRVAMLARTLRLLAGTLENAKSLKDFGRVLMALEGVSSLVRLCCFNSQKQMIENAKFDIDLTETVNDYQY